MKITRATYNDFVSTLLVVLFTYAALSKLLDYNTFQSQLKKSPYVMHMANFISWALPAAELFLVVLLLFPKTRTYGLYGCLFLLILFTEYIYAMLKFSFYIPCSCGGILSSMDWNQHLLFNILFTFLSVSGILLNPSSLKRLNTT